MITVDHKVVGRLAPVEAWGITGKLRWIVPQGTTTESAKLQQEWREQYSGKSEWRSVPRVVVPDAEFSAS